jgi:Uncharacterized Fe-S protein
MFNTREFSDFLYDNGATLVGFADLSGIVKDDLKYGVSMAIRIPPEIVSSIHDGPNRAYFNAYHDLNSRLNILAKKAAEYLKDKGYSAFAQTTDVVHTDEFNRTKMPHKTVAVNAGLGFIGKSALFVTKEYGSAIRLTSVLTDAPLETGEPVTESACGNCQICTEACPAKAISGRLWSPDLDREAFFSAETCKKKARELSAKLIHEKITICGKCIEACPYTQGYIKRY